MIIEVLSRINLILLQYNALNRKVKLQKGRFEKKKGWGGGGGVSWWDCLFLLDKTTHGD